MAIFGCLLTFVLRAICFGIEYYLLNQEEKQRYLTVLNQAHLARLKMLRYQLNPHFLFNTLNAVSALILDESNKMAGERVNILSRVLRYSLDNDPMQQVTVAEEITCLKLYLDIEKARFGDRLSLRYELGPDVQNALLPSLLVKPLVENSIKYAVSQSIDGWQIKISVLNCAGKLELIVSDNGPGMQAETLGATKKSGGVGLVNVREGVGRCNIAIRHKLIAYCVPYCYS